MTYATPELIEAARAWVADGESFRVLDLRSSARTLNLGIRSRREELEDTMAEWWRGTSRRGEYADVLAGVEIRSTNHADGTREVGMSVSRGRATIWAYGYRYAYRVAGTVAGYGSDGEPVLVDVKPTSKLMTAEQVHALPESDPVNLLYAELADAAGTTWGAIAHLAGL